MQSNSAPRATRFDLRLPVRFFTPEGIFPGFSKNISESGVSVQFDREVDIWIVGELNFLSGNLLFRLIARVARLDGREAGLSFKLRSELDTEVIRHLIAVAQKQPFLTEASG